VLGTVAPGRLVALTDLRGGGRHQLPWPSRLDDHVMALVTGHPDGRLAAVGFYPARSGAVQPSTFGCWTSPPAAGSSSPTCRSASVPANPSWAGPPMGGFRYVLW
jgi:hypothetical protein